MYKIFLVEDEYLLRESLRDTVDWKGHGFEFVGEAGDGEVALPLIRKTKPDLIITDIKMPFMDGLELSRLVAKEFPQSKIVIISGYDDFEYARQAIELQVDQYLLKPITKATMHETLDHVREKFDKELEQKNYSEQYLKELQGYEQFERKSFFEALISGTLGVSEIYSQAEKLGIQLDASAYNILLFMIQPKMIESAYSNTLANVENMILHELEENSHFMLFRWNIQTYALIIKSDDEQINKVTEECMNTIRCACENSKKKIDWYVASGVPVNRVSMMSQCFAEANHRLSYRHLLPTEHILREDCRSKLHRIDENLDNISSLDVEQVDPLVIRNFLSTGIDSEVDEFVDSYILNLGNALNSLMLRQYIMLNTRFNAAIQAKSFGADQDLVLNQFPDMPIDKGADGVSQYLKDILHFVIALRDQETKSRYNSILKKAIEYIDANYADENMSLNTVAMNINVSANYFSAIFSQEMGKTFIEYLTEQRMEHAKQLLRQSSKRSGEIAYEVGYRDPRYFSFIFKKTVGSTPRDYRANK